MIRENCNPKNANLNLDVDWSVEYTNTDQRHVNYDLILKSQENLDLSFKLRGVVKLEDFEEFVQYECSQIIFNHACSILMNMISLTRQHNYALLRENIGSTVNFSSAL